MQLFSSFLFGVSASLDALIVGITYGIRQIHIRFWHNLLISLITLTGTCLSVVIGGMLMTLLPASFVEIIGGGLLILLGCYYLLKFMISSMKKFLKSKKTATAEIQQTSNKTAPVALTIAEASFLGITLSANNMGIGLSASIAGLSLAPAAIVTFLCSFLFLLAGNRLGRCRVLQLAEHYADPISGILLIILGLFR